MSATSEILVPNLVYPTYLNLNPNDTEHLYCAVGKNSIIKIPKDGTSYTTFVSGINTLEGFAFDLLNNLYFSGFGYQGNNTGFGIYKLDQNGDVIKLFTSSNYFGESSRQWQVVFYNGYLYCLTKYPDCLIQVNIETGIPTKIIDIPNTSTNSLAVDNNGYFYVSTNDGLLYKITSNGSEINIYNSTFPAIGIELNNNILYGCMTYVNPGLVKRLFPNGFTDIFLNTNLDNPQYLLFDIYNGQTVFYITIWEFTKSDGPIVKAILNTEIYVNPIFDKILSDPPFSLDAISTSSSPIIYVSSDTNVAIVNQSGLVTITGPGTCTITLTQVDASANTIINVSRDTITVQSEFNKLLGDPPFPLDATSTSSSPIIYHSSNESVATVNESGIVTITGPGSSTITLTQYFGDIVDTSANSIINVSRNTITVQSEFNKIINNSSFPLNATSTSSSPIIYESSNEDIATVNESGIVTIIAPGSCTITLTQYFEGYVDALANTIINIYNNEPFGNVSAMAYDINNHLLYVYSNNQYPNNFITIDNGGNTNSLNIPTPNTNILSISILNQENTPIYVGGTFNSLSGNQNNVNISELKNVNIPYSSIHLSVNNTFVDNIENDQTIGVITTNTGLPFEISKNGP